jgi:putative flippase GtrA
VLAITNSFVVYRYLVFKVRGPGLFADARRFVLVYGAMFAANAAVLPFLVEVAGLPVVASQAILLGATIVAGFVVHKRFTFRRIGAPTALER